MAEQHAALKADCLEQRGQHFERLATHIVERARQCDWRRGAIAGARIDEDAHAGGRLQAIRKITPQCRRAEPLMQHHDGRRLRRRRPDHAVFEIAVADVEEAGGLKGHANYPSRHTTYRALSPLEGESWRGGYSRTPRLRTTPLPTPPPQGGRERESKGGESRARRAATLPFLPSSHITASPLHHLAA